MRPALLDTKVRQGLCKKTTDPTITDAKIFNVILANNSTALEKDYTP